MSLLVVRRWLPRYIITVDLDENYIFGSPLKTTIKGPTSRDEEVVLCQGIKPSTSLKNVQLMVIGVAPLACLENDRIKEFNYQMLSIYTNNACITRDVSKDML